MAVEPTARVAEREIDAAYESAPLLARTYPDAMFHTLLVAEALLGRGGTTLGRQDRAITLDMLINTLKHALGWIRAKAAPPERRQTDIVEAVSQAEELLELAETYLAFATAYTYASRDIIDLQLDGRELRVTSTLTDETRYEAYNLLVKPTLETHRGSNDFDQSELASAVRRALESGVVHAALPTLRPVMVAAYRLFSRLSAPFYELPESWRFGDFNLAGFRKVNDALRAVVYVWQRIVEHAGSEDFPYAAFFPFLVPRRELIAAVKDVTMLPRGEIARIIELLTYGSCGIDNPDPALQPLIELSAGTLVLSTPLVMGTAAERNLTALLNRLPTERRLYASLTQQKEALMRERMIRRLPPFLHSWHGHLRGHNDTLQADLAVVGPGSETLLFLELKWFIDPAEPRELDERSEELEKGVVQCKRLTDAVRADPKLVTIVTNHTISHISAAVVSANWIGLANVQDSEVPIINEEHLLAKIASTADLRTVTSWLVTRAYLPVEQVHFRTHVDRVSLAGSNLDWYGIEAVQKEAYLPL